LIIIQARSRSLWNNMGFFAHYRSTPGLIANNTWLDKSYFLLYDRNAGSATSSYVSARYFPLSLVTGLSTLVKDRKERRLLS